MAGANSIDIHLVLGDEHPLASQVSRWWTEWKSARNEAEDRWNEVRKYVYATSTRETANRANPHDHSTHVPKIAQVRDNLEANYLSALNLSGDFLRFEGHDPESDTHAKKKAILAYLETKNKLNGFPQVMGQLVRDWIETGNCFAGVTYCSEFHKDPESGDLVPAYVGPKVYRISPYDIVFNPLATSFAKSPKIIRTLKTMGELHRDLEENPELGYSADVIAHLEKTRENLTQYTDVEINKNIQLSYDGFGSASAYYNSGHVELLELYGDIYNYETKEWMKNQVITVADKRFIIRMEPLNTWSGMPDIYHCGWRTRQDNLWGMGPLDNLVGMQYYINHLENARADAFDQMLDSDRKIFGDVELEYRGAAIDYYIAEGGDVTFLTPDTTVLNADFAIERKENQMEEFAGAPKQAMGIRTPGEKTATEVSQLQNAASRIFQSKITYFEENLLEPVVNAEIEVARRNIDAIDIVKIMDDDFGVAEFLEVTPEDLKSNGKLVPVGARHFARQSVLAQNMQSFMAAMQQDQMMAQHFPSERIARAWEDLLGFQKLELFKPYGRVDEQLEMQQRMQAADQIAAESQEVPAAVEQGLNDA